MKLEDVALQLKTGTSVSVDSKVWERVAALVEYYMADINWGYNDLTFTEQLIVRNGTNLKAIKAARESKLC